MEPDRVVFEICKTNKGTMEIRFHVKSGSEIPHVYLLLDVAKEKIRKEHNALFVGSADIE